MVLQWSFRAHLQVVRYSTLAVRNLVPVYFVGLFAYFVSFASSYLTIILFRLIGRL